MSNVIQLKGEATVRGPEANSEIVEWLRDYADKLENGEMPPAQMAILVLYEDRGEQFKISTAYCNATTVERAGMLSTSLHDTLEARSYAGD